MAESIGVQVGIVLVILCGGSGTRLWPLSRHSFPKQFMSLIGGKSLLTLTAERLSHLRSSALLAVGAEDHRFLIAGALATSNQSNTVILEPVARNTTAAIALAALALHTTEADPYLLFCPADHHIPDARAFVDTVHSAFRIPHYLRLQMVKLSRLVSVRATLQQGTVTFKRVRR